MGTMRAELLSITFYTSLDYENTVVAKMEHRVVESSMDHVKVGDTYKTKRYRTTSGDWWQIKRVSNRIKSSNLAPVDPRSKKFLESRYQAHLLSLIVDGDQDANAVQAR
jgi:hypothetical protein